VFLTVGKQLRDGTSEVRGRIDPETRGLWDAVSAKSDAPGMCNPDDQNPCIDGEHRRQIHLRQPIERACQRGLCPGGSARESQCHKATGEHSYGTGGALR
jgi:hypothetical protein